MQDADVKSINTKDTKKKPTTSEGRVRMLASVLDLTSPS
jgi:hypothetical protein